MTSKPVVEPTAPVVAPAEMPGPIAMAIARVVASFDLPIPHAFVDRFVQWELGARDYLHAATDKVAALAATMPNAIPDITILTIQPIPDTLSSGYGWRDDPIRHTWKFHGGTDFPSDPG
ncbi:MAG TPA: hypothetical protein VFQ65_28895, partial [Kofleriaceae bacterium]|nr:hypothetical protein [Kofleriaceae bacterium]